MEQVSGVGLAILAVLPKQMALLERLVNINSYSANRAGVNLVQQVLADEFQALGLQVRRFSCRCRSRRFSDWGNRLCGGYDPGVVSRRHGASAGFAI